MSRHAGTKHAPRAGEARHPGQDPSAGLADLRQEGDPVRHASPQTRRATMESGHHLPHDCDPHRHGVSDRVSLLAVTGSGPNLSVPRGSARAPHAGTAVQTRSSPRANLRQTTRPSSSARPRPTGTKSSSTTVRHSGCFRGACLTSRASPANRPSQPSKERPTSMPVRQVHAHVRRREATPVLIARPAQDAEPPDPRGLMSDAADVACAKWLG